MISCPCPQCGAPVRAAVATPDVVRCRSCNYQGPPPPAAAEALRAAWHILSHTDAHKRQFSSTLRRALTSSRFHAVRFVLASAVFLVPATLVTAVLTFAFLTSDNEIGRFVLIVLFAYALLLGVAAWGWRRVRRTRVALEDAVAAEPPESPGEPAACPVCGGDLPHADTSSVVRCRYCQADSFVGPVALGRAHARLGSAITDATAAVARASSAIGQASSQGTTFICATVLASPIVMFLGLLAAVIVNSVVLSHLPPSGGNKYVLMPVARGSCAGIVDTDIFGKTYVSFSTGTPAKYMSLAEAKAQPHVGATFFVGKRVTAGELAGTATGAHGGLFGDEITIRRGDGTSVDVSIPGVCLAR